MGTKTDKRTTGGATARKKKKVTPQFLLVVNGDETESIVATGKGAASFPSTVAEKPDAVLPAGNPDYAGDGDWPGREDIRDGLVDQVTARFGIPPEVAKRAVNDMLRLA